MSSQYLVIVTSKDKFMYGNLYFQGDVVIGTTRNRQFDSHGNKSHGNKSKNEANETLCEFKYQADSNGISVSVSRIDDDGEFISKELKHALAILQLRGCKVEFQKAPNKKSVDYWKVEYGNRPIRRLTDEELIKFTLRLITKD